MEHEHPAITYYGSVRALARALSECRGSISHSALSTRLREGRPLITAEEAIAIERSTGGDLRRSQLRPDLWQDVAP